MSLSVAPVRLWVSLRMTELLDTVKSKVDERHQNRQQENKNSTARAFVIIDDRILYIFEHNTLVLDESCRNLSCAHVQEIGSEIFRHLFAYFCRKKAKVLIKTSFWIKSSVHCHVSLRCCRLIESKYRHWSERSFFHTSSELIWANSVFANLVLIFAHKISRIKTIRRLAHNLYANSWCGFWCECHNDSVILVTWSNIMRLRPDWTMTQFGTEWSNIIKCVSFCPVDV